MCSGIRTDCLYNAVNSVSESKPKYDTAEEERYVEKLRDQMDNMMKKDEEIMEQHEDLFKILKKGDTPSGSYNY